MSEPEENRPSSLGVYDRPETRAITGLEIAATAFTVLWLALAGGWLLLSDTENAQALQFILALMVLVFPVAMVWVAATAARSSRILREESARLQVAIDAMRKSYVTQAQQGKDQTLPSLLRKVDEIAASQKKSETALLMFTSARPTVAPTPEAPAPMRGDGEQPALALGTPAEALAPELPRADIVRALHFPETAEDHEGFAALRRALKHRQTAQLVQAAQDVLTLLSQDGIYMDDLRPDPARPEVWRRFAKGERGRAVAALGGIRDRSSLALTAGRMKQDAIFRDAAHHFLRVFDRNLVSYEDGASDEEIVEFSGTRTARAFMLLGRVAGTFD